MAVLSSQTPGSAPETAERSLEDLLEAVAARDQRAFRLLFDRASPKLLGIVIRILKRKDAAEDVVQDVFVKVWNGQARFDRAAGSGMAFLGTIARNRALDVLRRRQFTETSDDAEMEAVMDLMPSPETVAADRGDLRALMGCLDALADGPRRALVSAYLDGSTGEEIAREIGSPLGTVKSWLHRGLASLRECMGRGPEVLAR